MSPRGRAVIWGLGRFGGGVAAFAELRRQGYAVDVIDKRPADELAQALRAAGHGDSLETQDGAPGSRFLPEEPGSLEGAGLVVLNPAIRPTHPLLLEIQQRGIPRSQELDLALSAYPGRVLAVTGTNGKSSTTALTQHLLAAAGFDALRAGNIGQSLLELREHWRSEQVAVVEISSFQSARLAQTERLSGLLLSSLDVDHLDWHGDLESYHRDKLRLATALRQDGFFLAHASDTALVEHVRQMQQMDPVQHAKALPMRPRLLGEDPELPQLDPEGAILLGEQVLLPADSPFARARALRENAALALAAVQQLGGDVHQAARALLDYPGLPHRLESLGKKRGVEFVDNGVSTVARTSEVAIESFAPERPVHWICGGHPKGPDLDAHVALAPRCASVHLFGEIAARLHAALLEAGHAARCTGPHEQMRDALRAACETASSGEIVLFSPAFSSHDAYANFAERAAEARELWAGFASE